MLMEITVPFKCSKCGMEFLQNEGGICSSCGKLFCLAHLNIIRDSNATKLLCVDCKGREKDKRTNKKG
jgi:DNA-directed RNA polymerase subunit RPC12/RpoP